MQSDVLNKNLNFEFCHKANCSLGAVLLFHGLTGSPFEMKKYGQFLHRIGYDVYAYCLPGHGDDVARIREVKWQDWVSFSEEKFLKICQTHKNVFVAGLCMGAVLCLILAQKYPQKVKGVISLSTTLYLDGWTMPWYNFMMPLGVNTIIRYYYTFPEREPYGIKNISKRRSIQKLMGKTTVAMDNYPMSCIFELLKMSKYARKNIKKVENPILIIHAKDDDLTSIKSAKFVYKNISSQEKEIVILNDSYHLVLYDNEKEFVYQKSFEFLTKFSDLKKEKEAVNA